MKLSKNKKIILLLTGIGILTTSIVTPIILLNKDEENKQLVVDTIKKIIAKIKDKDILIAPNVSTQNQSEIQNAIKNQLKKENQTLNEDDLSKITINNINSLKLGDQIEVTLTIKINSAIKKLTINVEKINLLKNSNINNGMGGTIFQDKFKNLWAMGFGKKLQVLKVNSDGKGYKNTWVNDNNKDTGHELLKNSNIDDGYFGKIFQDSFGNLWTMNIKKNLQVLKAKNSKDGYVSTGWTDDKDAEGLLNGSNITNGNNGIIFQDKFKNLWAMGYGTKLQVLKVNDSKNGYVSNWIDDKDIVGLTYGSNIINGNSGKIFQDSFGNLWTMGSETKLQVLKANLNDGGYTSEGWTDDNTQGLLNGSNITNGNNGTIFQDSFKNLWAMGNDQKLQVLKANSEGNGYENTWINNNHKNTGHKLLKNSNINDGSYGTIFQDSFKNLWIMGNDQKLQVLKAKSDGTGYVSKGWNNDNTQGLTNGSNITNGSFGAIFQDSFKNLWAMGSETKLQVLKVNSEGNGYENAWVNNNHKNTGHKLLKNSNINNGGYGKIFQDSFKNLWIIAYNQKLKVLIANSDNTSYINSWL